MRIQKPAKLQHISSDLLSRSNTYSTTATKIKRETYNDRPGEVKRHCLKDNDKKIRTNPRTSLPRLQLSSTQYLRHTVLDQVEMHDNIGKQSYNWNALFLSSVNTITLTATSLVEVSTGVPGESLLAPFFEYFNHRENTTIQKTQCASTGYFELKF